MGAPLKKILLFSSCIVKTGQFSLNDLQILYEFVFTVLGHQEKSFLDLPPKHLPSVPDISRFSRFVPMCNGLSVYLMEGTEI